MKRDSFKQPKNEPHAPLVSVQCLVYNHEPYLHQCLDGIVSQKTSFEYEVIVHDDASTDGSAAIIREYVTRYPDKIVPIYETENLYTKGDGSLSFVMDSACRGKYIAICEGDDYWTDSEKLQRQVDFLEAHPDYSLSAENGIQFFVHTGEEAPFSNEPEHDVSIEDLLTERRFPTASVVFRSLYLRDVWKMKPPFFDTLRWACLAQCGKIHYSPVISSVYRRGDGVTSKDPVYWASLNYKLNKSLFRNITMPQSVKKWRKDKMLSSLFAAFFVAKKQKRYADALSLLLNSLSLSPTDFFFRVIKNKLERKL